MSPCWFIFHRGVAEFHTCAGYFCGIPFTFITCVSECKDSSHFPCPFFIIEWERCEIPYLCLFVFAIPFVSSRVVQNVSTVFFFWFLFHQCRVWDVLRNPVPVVTYFFAISIFILCCLKCRYTVLFFAGSYFISVEWCVAKFRTCGDLFFPYFYFYFNFVWFKTQVQCFLPGSFYSIVKW